MPHIYYNFESLFNFESIESSFVKIGWYLAKLKFFKKTRIFATIAQLFHGATNDEKMQELLMWLSVGCSFSQMLLARLLEVFQIPQKLLVMVKTLFFTLAHIFMLNSVIFQPIFYILAVLGRRKI